MGRPAKRRCRPSGYASVLWLRRTHISPTTWSWPVASHSFCGVSNSDGCGMNHLIERRRWAVCALTLAVGVSALFACATGPKDTLSGNWSGSGFSLSLRQSGSRVTGTSCTVVPVSGSVQGSDFELAIDTGASAVDYTGAFVNATTISLNQTGNVNVAVGGITLYKGPPSLSADCIFSQQ
jgi:hypothetical protein